MAAKKYYVVWRGATPGVYTTWDECKAQVSGHDGALYKSFSSLETARKAFSGNPWKYIGSAKNNVSGKKLLAEGVISGSLAVDAACSGNPGKMEYRGVWVDDYTEVFRVGPYDDGTNNIGEFLAIVHALALCKKENRAVAIYSDSVNAMKWVKKKKCNTKLLQTSANRPVFELIERAEKWLQENTYVNPILKWNTEHWGENPADFGRK